MKLKAQSKYSFNKTRPARLRAHLWNTPYVDETYDNTLVIKISHVYVNISYRPIAADFDTNCLLKGRVEALGFKFKLVHTSTFTFAATGLFKCCFRPTTLFLKRTVELR